jgi:hypothetical protein
VTDPIPDRERLRQRSADGLRRAVKVALIVAALVFVAIIGFFLALSDDLRGGSSLVIVPAGLGAAAGIVVLTVVATRRMSANAPLLMGADRSTRDAVTRALRAGGTDDPRIDALARDAARGAGMQWWVVGAGLLLALVEASSLVIRIAGGEWSRAVFAGLLTVVMGTVAAKKWAELHRYRAYLREPGPAQAPRTAA